MLKLFRSSRSIRRWIHTDTSRDALFPVKDIRVIPDFITAAQELSLMKHVELKLKRHKYALNHFDSVITNYRECPVSEWPDDECADVITNMKEAALEFHPSSKNSRWKPIHVLDLSAEGGSIGPHTDNIEYSGKLVSGLCLLSSAVMTFQHAVDTSRIAKVLLPRRCFYLTTASVRFDYKHEISVDQMSGMYEFQGSRFPRERRVSLMLRDNC